jgi:hypothetical protein
VSIDGRINTDPVLSIGQSPHKEVIALGTLLIIAVLDEEVPSHFVIAEAVERQDLCANVVDVIVACFNEEDRVACACKVDGDCAYMASALETNTSVS